MANVQITQLPQAGTITGTEAVPIVQNGQTVQTTTGAIAASPSQTQTFLTLNQEPTLPNSRALAGGTGVGLVDNGAQSTLEITLNGASGSLEAAGNGVIAKTGSGSVTARSVTVSGNGLSVTNGDGVSGNPDLSLTGLPAALASVGGTGMLAVVGGSLIAGRQIYGTSGEILVTDGNGAGNPTIALDTTTVTPGTYNYSTITVDGFGRITSASSGSVTSGTVTNVLGTADQISVVNSTTTPTISIADNPVLPGTASVTLPKGGTAARAGVPINGMLRYNTDIALFEGYINGAWTSLASGSGVTSVATGTGLTGGPITSTGTISIDNTVVATLTDTQTLTNKTISGSANTLTNIGNGSLTNSSVTINGSTVSLGGSTTITATATNALTIGTGLSGTSYNGSSPVTIAIDSTVATLSGVQTLTNKSISGSTNTFTNIPNSGLTNSSLTIGSTSVSLGGTTTTLAGLTSVTLTQDPTSDLQAATKQYVDSIASGLNYHQPVNYASTAALPAYTYNNGSSGVGATITANANGALSFGGGSPTATQRLLVKDEAGANQPYNGIYTVTQAGSAGTPFILTRATDYDTSGTGTNEIDAGDYVLVLSGTNASTAWVQQTTLPIVVGTTALVFLQFNAPITYTAGTGLNLSPATTFNISNTGVTAATYGSASSVPTIAINAQGQITSASNTSIAINGNQITSGTVGVTYGGTGLSGGTSGGIPYFSGSTTIASSSALAANALVIGGGAGVAPSTTNTGTGVLTALGTNVGSAGAFVVNGGALGTPSSGTVTNLTGTASININGTVGATTPTSGAFTTISASGVITSTVATGTAPFTVASTTQVANLNAATAGTATNATNVAITSNSTNATNYLTFVSATSGNLGQLVNSSITCNPSTGAITGGISGGTF
jgi:hypothetical protein